MVRTRAGYTWLLRAVLPAVFLRLAWRARRQPAYLERIPERFGFYREKPEKPVLWVHAVSVGETRAASPLIARLLQAYPGRQILFTHMTPTGRETGEALYGDRVLRCYLPYDFPSAVARFLDHFRPEIGLLMETEIWINLIHACRARAIPLLLVNARLSEKSATRYGRFGALASEALGGLAAVAAQTQADAERLRALGASAVEVMGNLKFDVTPDASALSLGKTFRCRFGENRPVFLAASTREGEEALILDALEEVGWPGLLTVIVPRHPQRFEEVAALLEARGIAFQRRSREQAVAADTRVVLGDSMGEMFAYYCACDVAFVGGSLLPYGGQNLIEAAACGKPILVGPHTYNFQEAADRAVEVQAALRVQDGKELAAALARLLADAGRRQAMGQAGLAFAARHRGAVERALEIIARFLKP